MNHGKSSRNSATFSQTVRAGIRLKFWNTIPMPSRRAARGEAIVTGRPAAWNLPASGR
jgi:hypothetical protein